MEIPDQIPPKVAKLYRCRAGRPAAPIAKTVSSVSLAFVDLHRTRRWYYTLPRSKVPSNPTGLPVPFMSLQPAEVLSQRVRGVRKARVLRIVHGLGDEASDMVDGDLDFKDRQRLVTGEGPSLASPCAVM